MIKNIMSVDLEDYFCDLPFSEWSQYPHRIIETTQVLLDLFDKHHVKATFFALGYFADKFPDLIKNIHEQGHELASHSYSHPDLRKITKNEFENDFVKSLKSIEKVTGEKVLGFRAPYFSINHKNFWVFDIMRKHIAYDSSVFPVKTSLYGLPSAPRDIYHPAVDDVTKKDESQTFIEVPPSTYHIFSHYNIPIAGGFYFRFFPYFFLKKGFKKLNKEKKPITFYIHPKDLDVDMPKIDSYSWHFYYGKRNIIKKFEKLLKEFEFTSIKDFLGL
jgi:polysaccharide deacetylase family protein (PEP-CTERM system associated)